MNWPARGSRAAARAGLVVVVALGAAGCWGSGEPQSDEAAAEEAARDYVDAYVESDGALACGLMTDEVRFQFEAIPGVEGCPAAFERASDRLPEEQRGLLADADIVIDEVAGDMATVTIRVSEDLENPVELRRVGGRWLFATPPLAP